MMPPTVIVSDEQALFELLHLLLVDRLLAFSSCLSSYLEVSGLSLQTSSYISYLVVFGVQPTRCIQNQSEKCE